MTRTTPRDRIRSLIVADPRAAILIAEILGRPPGLAPPPDDA